MLNRTFMNKFDTDAPQKDEDFVFDIDDFDDDEMIAAGKASISIANSSLIADCRFSG